MPIVLLSTERLVLRRFEARDLGSLQRLHSDPRVMHFITGGAASAPGESAEVLLPHWRQYENAHPAFGFWAADELATGRLLGWFHLRPGEADPISCPELGYRLSSEVWGCGLATEGTRALVDRAFDEPYVERVRAETMVVHTASRRVLQKAGFRVVRYFHADWPYPIPGDEWGDVEYAVDRADWSST